MCLKLLLMLPLRLHSNLGQLDSDGLTHEVRGREVVIIAGAYIVFRRLSKCIELVLGLVLRYELVSRQKVVVLIERILEYAAFYVRKRVHSRAVQ